MLNCDSQLKNTLCTANPKVGPEIDFPAYSSLVATRAAELGQGCAKSVPR
jgi:hypothetical protein